MIELNEPLQQGLDARPGQPLRVIDPRTQQAYILVRADEFERLHNLLQDDTALGKWEVAVLVERAMREYDENDPSLELYQHD